MSGSPSRLRLLVSRIAVIVFSFVATIAVADVGFRVFWLKRWVISSGEEDSKFHHSYKPNTEYHYQSDEFDVVINTNSHGLRGPDPVLPKPPGTTRILMLGDSMTYGFPVEDDETFSHLIEQGLQADGYAVDIVNAGHSGYSPTLSYIRLREQFLAFEPDLVVLWYDLGDIQDDYWYQKNLLYDDEGNIVGADPRYTYGRFNWWEWTVNHSALAKWLNNKPMHTLHKMRILGIKDYIKAKLRGERSKVAIARLKRQQKAPDVANADRFVLVRESSTRELVDPAWDLSATYLKKIKDLLDERDIAFGLGVYPYGINAGPDEWAEGRTNWGFEPGKIYDPGLAVEVFQEFAAHEGILLINTFDSFQEAAAAMDQKLFYDRDVHMTPTGHRVLAMHVLKDQRFLELLQ